jgi:hypothetical protein
MSLYELGANYYLTGTLGPKLSLGYKIEPFWKTGINTQSDRKSMLHYETDFF